MEADKTNDSTTGETEKGDLTVIAIPAEQAPAVLEFMAKLQKDETSEVSGHMLSRGITGGFGGTLMAKAQDTSTWCNTFLTGRTQSTDYHCGDVDKIETT